MSRRSEYESLLLGVYPVFNNELETALEGALEEAYDEGVAEAHEEYLANGLSEKSVKEIQARYEYLKHGGEWQRDLVPVAVNRDNKAENYLAGFLDAMNTIGVKP